jgi:UDP-glucose:(heptosyl)LPS alpha-1,3-glucosyltransferase
MATRPFSIAIVRQRYAADGGAERFVERMLEVLAGVTARVTLITREWLTAPAFEAVTANPFYLGRLWRDWSFARAVRQLLKSRHFDLVQSHERIAGCEIYRAGDGVHRQWLAQRARILPTWRRGLQAINPYHRYLLRAEHALFRHPRLRAVICNSAMVRDDIHRRFGVAAERLHVIYNGIDLDVFHPRLRQHRAAIRARYAIPDDALLCLFVGSGFERKGVAPLLRALARLPANVYALVVGRDKHAPRYRRLAARLGVASRIVFAGSQADVRPFYGAADLLVLPTLYDPFPNVVLEALACGLPVLTSTSCGAAEVLANGRAGFVCDALDDAAIAAIIRGYAWSPAASAAARECATAFGADVMRGRLQELYRQLLGERTAPP